MVNRYGELKKKELNDNKYRQIRKVYLRLNRLILALVKTITYYFNICQYHNV